MFNPQPKPEKTAKTPKKPIRKFGVKRAIKNREYLKLRKEYLELNPICQAREPGCTYEATTIHHKKGRLGSLLTDFNNFLGVCMGCHQIIERAPIYAKKKGYSLDRL
jgi:hypothetical protein